MYEFGEEMVLLRHANLAETTEDTYTRNLEHFFRFIKAVGKNIEEKQEWLIRKAREEPKWTQNLLIKYAIYLNDLSKKDGLSGARIKNLFKPMWKLLDLNDITINKKRITMILPKERSHADDRAPTVAEIKKLLEYPDRRIRPAVLVMLSSGIRVGSWDYMKWGHIQPIERQGEIIAAKLKAHDTKFDEWYNTFLTPEAYYAIKEYIDFRSRSGEHITEESWVLRNKFAADESGRSGSGLASKPRRLTSKALSVLIARALHAQGVRDTLPEGKHRYEFQTDHGFRKFFETNCKQAGITESDVEWLMNHHDSYHRPTEEQLLESYLEAVPNLTISEQVKVIERLDKIDELEEDRRNDQTRILELERSMKEMQETVESVKEEFEGKRKRINRLTEEGTRFEILSREEKIARTFCSLGREEIENSGEQYFLVLYPTNPQYMNHCVKKKPSCILPSKNNKESDS